MRIIVVYVSAGKGHQRAAEAVYNYFKSRDSNLEIELIDALTECNLIFREIYTHGYNFLVRHSLWLWRFAFWLTLLRPLRKICSHICRINHHFNLHRFEDTLIKKNPDFIISTHFMTSEVAAYLKRRKMLGSKIFSVITDFDAHPLWINSGTDMYIVACNVTKESLSRQGVSPDMTLDLGIPIDLKFSQKYPRDVLARRLNIDKDRFTVLVVTGSFGIGPIEEIVKSLCLDVQLLAVCAQNKKLFLRLKKKNYPNVSVYGFVDNLVELMAVSDIIITKPGGLSISEVMSMELVPIFISSIPGQETQNAGILKMHKIGFSPQSIEEIRNIVLSFKRQPQRLESIKEQIRKIKKPYAVEEIYHAICLGSLRYPR